MDKLPNHAEANRKLPERWHIKICPGCNGIIEGCLQTHLGDCPYRDKIFVPRSVEVSPIGGR